MGKASRLILTFLVVTAFPAGMALAEGGSSGGDSDDGLHGKVSPGKGLAVGGACLGVFRSAIGGGYAIARVGGHCIESMARQPEATGNISTAVKNWIMERINPGSSAVEILRVLSLSSARAE